MTQPIKVAIVEDHQSIIDGYVYRLSSPEFHIVGFVRYGEDMEALLEKHIADVLLLDIYVPTSRTNSNPFPVLHLIPKLISQYPQLKILVISMLNLASLIEALVEAGINGYIFKEDYDSIQKLAEVVKVVASGGGFFSPGAYQSLRQSHNRLLTPRQMEALALCATYPDSDISILAKQLGITPSTYRNLLSGAYARLGVQTRTAAINKASQMGILTPVTLPIPDPRAENSDQ